MVKHTQTNCLSMFDDFVGLALKKLVYLCRVRLTLFWNLYKSNNWKGNKNQIYSSRHKLLCLSGVEGGPFNILLDCMIFLSLFQDAVRMFPEFSVHIMLSFDLWSKFPLTYDLELAGTFYLWIFPKNISCTL